MKIRRKTQLNSMTIISTFMFVIVIEFSYKNNVLECYGFSHDIFSVLQKKIQ